MSHQDRKSVGQIVVNHQSIRQAVNLLFAAKGCMSAFARRGGWSERSIGESAVFW
jgi:hypothetical protein